MGTRSARRNFIFFRKVNGAPEFHEVIVLGAGGAGLMCAIEAGRRGRRVLVIEHQDRVGKKIAISGGGRCNFTNLQAGPENYLSRQPDFCKSALARYTPWDFVALVEKHGIAYHEKKLGQQFCDRSSREIINLLLQECAEAGVEIRVNCRVGDVRKADRFVLESNTGRWNASRWSWPRAGCRFQNWDRRILATAWRGSLPCR